MANRTTRGLLTESLTTPESLIEEKKSATGPLYVKEKSGQMSKAYIALFSCCVTRAVHLQLVDLSTGTFRRSFRRFIAKRGMPVLIVSDNAKTFQATEKAPKKLFDHPEVKADLERDRIEWKFK